MPAEPVLIARCPEHGLHGERSECFVCGGPVEHVPMVPARTPLHEVVHRPAHGGRPAPRSGSVDSDLLKAIAWCRIGGMRFRPSTDRAFHRAKQLGLLAQDPCWRATARGEGVLIAARLLKGDPAPERAVIHVLWASSPRYTRPQFIRAWSDGFADMRAEQFEDQRAETEREWQDSADWALAGGPWEFWTTIEYLDAPEVPDAG
jgi:hypothetical protein